MNPAGDTKDPWAEIRGELQRLYRRAGSPALRALVADTPGVSHATAGDILGARRGGFRWPSLLALAQALSATEEQVEWFKAAHGRAWNAEAARRGVRGRVAWAQERAESLVCPSCAAPLELSVKVREAL